MMYINTYIYLSITVEIPFPPDVPAGTPCFNPAATKPRGRMTPMAAQEAATAEAMVTRGDVM